MLVGVHPDLVRVVELGIKYSPHDFAVTEGVRSIQDQMVNVSKGVSWTLHSKHLVQADGLGHAVDIEAVGDLDGNGFVDLGDKSRTWDPAVYAEIAKAMKRAAAELGVAIRWGGDFGGGHFDGPHYELV